MVCLCTIFNGSLAKEQLKKWWTNKCVWRVSASMKIFYLTTNGRNNGAKLYPLKKGVTDSRHPAKSQRLHLRKQSTTLSPIPVFFTEIYQVARCLWRAGDKPAVVATGLQVGILFCFTASCATPIWITLASLREAFELRFFGLTREYSATLSLSMLLLRRGSRSTRRK